MRRGLRAVIALFAVWSAAGHAQAPTTPQEPWPPPDVLLPGAPGLAPPELISSTQPKYTAEAIRARLQGVVRLSCVVEKDGTIGPVRVVQSLDTKFGLDDQAILTARQWRFKPGVKDGAPVRVLVTLDLGFAIRDDPPPASTWPSDFPPAATAALRSADWRHDTAEVPHLVIGLDLPKGWTSERGTEPTRPLVVTTEDHLRTAAIVVPGILSAPVRLPMPAAELQQFTEKMSASSGHSLKALGIGQVQAPSGWWVWQAYEFSAAQIANLVPGSTIATGAGPNARLWMFTTVAERHLVNVFCIATTASTETAPDVEWRKAAAVFQEILQRVTFQAR